IASLYADRQHERRNYYLAHGTSFAGLVAGATISVFVGPIGLPLLLVGTLGVVACESIGLRVVKVSDAVPLQERASLTTDRAFTRAIIDTHAELATLQALRHLRRPMYPAGWGTSFRPLLRLQRWVLRRRQRDAPGTRYAVLAAAEARNRLLPAVAAPLPGDRLLTLMERCRSAEAFYASLLKDEPVRRALEGHGVLRRKKRWFVFPDALSTRIDELQATPPLFERIHSHAEEVLLTYGKTQIHRRQRALLDLYGAFAAEVSREVPQVGVGRRAVQRRNSNCWVKGPAVASA
ncbi:MAG TPA: hypothetical protein VFH51_00845, partial [Myxococcota bacterium]|nr:hypothetical protein [Myxococcota bacterium]